MYYVIVFLIFTLAPICAQVTEPLLVEAPRIEWGGFVSFKIHANSRQVVLFKDGHTTLYPKPKSFDKCNRDRNKQASLDFTTIQTRIQMKGQLNDTNWVDRITGFIEGDFTGVDEITAQCFDLRLAYIQLEWQPVTLIVGQYYHPTFILDCFPDTVSFNEGAPFETLSRNPQIRFTAANNNWLALIATSLETYSFSSTGPYDYSPLYMRNAVMPEWNFQIKKMYERILFGGFFETKKLRPRLVNSIGNTVNEKILSWGGGGFGSFHTDRYYVSTKVLYMQNPTDLTMIGGYGVSGIIPQDIQCYTPTQIINWWLDTAYTSETGLSIGLFGGYSKNLGTVNPLVPDTLGNYTLYARNPEIDHVWRISPRVVYTIDTFRISGELEYTQAAYGTITKNGTVINSTSVGNVAFVLGAYYFF